MCRFPIRIKNKGYKVNDLLSPLYVDVPCGHCPECQQSRISEYLYRATYTFDDCIRKGGFACFLTLTFNSDSLNIVRCKNGFTCSTWNNVMLKKFKNRLQKVLLRCGYSYKYICTCERGKQGTKRPHYHLILFVFPNSVVTPLDSIAVSHICARLWSFKPRGNSFVDLSMKFAPFKPNTRFVAKNSPCGFIFNESISRTEHEAIKYVVKYCVKDSQESCFKLRDIVYSKFPISEIDMLPRTTQSNGIGISFLESFPNVQVSTKFNGSRVSHTYDIDPFNLDHAALHVLNSRSMASDGTPLNIPRYYIKKLCQRPVINCRFPLADDSLYFNGKEYAPKFKQKSPVHVLVNRRHVDDCCLDSHPDLITLHNYRECTRSTLDKSLFSVYLGNASINDLTLRLWDILCSLRVYRFNFMDNWYAPYFGMLDKKLVTRSFALLSDIDLTELYLLGYDNFRNLYFRYYHSAYCDNDITRLLSKFLSLVSFSRAYNSVENTFLNQKIYVQNLPNMVKKRPLLFVSRSEN